jgi:hypothetical protein
VARQADAVIIASSDIILCLISDKDETELVCCRRRQQKCDVLGCVLLVLEHSHT